MCVYLYEWVYMCLCTCMIVLVYVCVCVFVYVCFYNLQRTIGNKSYKLEMEITISPIIERNQSKNTSHRMKIPTRKYPPPVRESAGQP